MKTLITGALKINKEQLKKLEDNGLDIIFLEDERKIIDFCVSDIEYVICNGLFLYNDIKKFKNLKYIQLTSAGLDRVPVDYIEKNNIKLYNARGVYSIPMAEWTICKIFDIYKNSFKFYENQKISLWEKDRSIVELNGKTATIVGYGSVGHEIATRLSSFNVTINVVDIYEKKDNIINKFYYIKDIETALKTTDILILTLPLTKETEGIMNKEKLQQMKEDSVLVNISRGKIINEKDLVEILKTGKYSGVVLDVFEDEPLNKTSELWNFKNCIITPHNSFVSNQNNERLVELIIKNLKENFI